MLIVGKQYYVVNNGYGLRVMHVELLSKEEKRGYKIKGLDKYSYGTQYFNKEAFFKTKQEASDFAKNEDNKVIEICSKEINNVEDLVRFCLKNIPSTPEDYLTLDVATSKAREFGIDIY